MNRQEFHGLAVWVCAGRHQDLVMFLTSDEDGNDLDNCPTCGANVLESDEIFPLFLSTEDPAGPTFHNKEHRLFTELMAAFRAYQAYESRPGDIFQAIEENFGGAVTILTILLCFVLGGLFAGTLYLLGKQAGSFDEKPISQATMRKYRQD